MIINWHVSPKFSGAGLFCCLRGGLFEEFNHEWRRLSRKLKLFVNKNKQHNIDLSRGKYQLKLGYHDKRNYCKTWFLMVPFLLPVCEFVQPDGQESEGMYQKNAHAWCYTEV